MTSVGDVASFVLALICLTSVYSLGHFAIGEALGCKVRRVEIGFGPKLARFTLGHTEFALGVLFLGSSVNFENDDDRYVSLPEQPLFRHLAIVVAGPFAVVLMAWVALLLVNLVYGADEPTPSTRVGGIVAESPMERAGLVPGDVIVSVAGKGVSDWSELAAALRDRAGTSFGLTFMRQSDTSIAHVESAPGDAHTIAIPFAAEAILGLRREVRRLPVSPAEGARRATASATYAAYLVGLGITELIRGRVLFHQLSSMVSFARDDGPAERLRSVLLLYSFLAINLAVLNMLPIPSLIGADVVQVLLEGLRGRPFTERQLELTKQVGLLILISLMVVVLYRDLQRLRGDPSETPPPAPVPAPSK